jgi:hypothetical protein
LEPGEGRYRQRVVRAVACVLLLSMLAACSSGSSAPKSAPPDPGISLPGGTPAPQNSTEVCTKTDLAGPALAMPLPQVISSSVFIRTGIVATVDPAPGPAARFTAAQAWAKFTRLTPLHARSADLMLGTFSANLPYGPHGPGRVEVLAWVLRLDHLAYPQPVTGGTGGSGLTRKKSPPCEFVDAVLVLDATTGAVVVYSY